MENGFFLSEYLSARYLEKGERVSAKHEKEFKKANRETNRYVRSEQGRHSYQ